MAHLANKKAVIRPGGALWHAPRDTENAPDYDRLVAQLIAATQTASPSRRPFQQPGGFVITDQTLDSLVPVENAAMKGRTVIQWGRTISMPWACSRSTSSP